MESIDVVPCRSVPEPQTSHRTRLPTNGEEQAKGWRNHCHTAENTGLLEGVHDGTLGLKHRILCRIHTEIAACISK